MAGFVPYGNGGFYPYSSSSPSSLSALAPPFTVDRSVPKPMSSPLDVTETPYVAPMNSSLHNWLPSHPTTTGSNFFANPTPDFNSIPSSNAYGYAGLQAVEPSNTNLPPLMTITTASSSAFKYAQSFDAAATSFVEAKPYYPSYLSSTIPSLPPTVVPNQPSYDWLSTTHFAPLDSSSHKDYAQNPSDPKYTTQWSGLWEREQGKQGDFSGNFCSKKTDVSGSSLYKNYKNQDPSHDEASHSINIMGWEKLGGSVSAEHSGDKSFVAKNSKFIPADFSKSVTGSFSAVPEAHPRASSSQIVTNTTKCKTPYSVFSEQRQNDASMDDISSTSKSSSAFAIRIPVIGTKSAEPEIGLFKGLNFRSDAAETDRGHYCPSSVQESRLPQVSEANGRFSSSQHDSLLGINDSFFKERKGEPSNNRSLNQNPWDHLFKAKTGLENPHVSPCGFNVELNTNENINSFPSSSDNVDPNNPAVDSPCWKGVPGSRFSPFESSGGGVPEQIKKLEDCSGLHFPMPLMFPLHAAENVSSQKPIKNTVEYHDIGWLENGPTLPLKRDSVENSAFEERKSDDAAKTPYDSEISHDRGPQSYRDVFHKSGNGDNSFGLFGHSYTMEQGHGGEVGLATEIKKTTLSCGPDVKLDVSDTMEYGSSHAPSHAVENILFSSFEDAPTKLSKSDEEDSMPKVDAQMLVDTMNSLSELLLSNCSYGLVQLKKNDIEAIKSVINNLHICISMNGEKWSPTQEMPSFQQNTAKCNGEFPEHNKVVSADRAPLASAPLASASNIQDEVIGSVFGKSDKNMVKEDKMTQAIKKILSENFHAEETDPQALLYKNLWLEAEAVLCSINYKARFNRVKIEMDKCEAEKSKAMMQQSVSEVSPDINPVNPLTPDTLEFPTSNLQDLPVLSQEDDVLARFRILRDLVENTNSIGAANGSESSSKVSEPNKVDNIPPEVNGSSSSHCISLQDSPTSDTVGMTDDYDEASVMARFRIIRDRVEKSQFISFPNMEESSSSNVCLEPKTDIIAPNASDVSAPEFSFQDSSISINTSQSNACEASVLSGLNILKSRIENYADLHTEGQLLPKPKISAVAQNTSDSLLPEFTIQDSPRSSTIGQSNDCEASVMSRLQILKSRIDNSYMHSEEQQLPETDGLGYAGKRNPWPFISKRSEGGSSELKEQPIFQSHEADSSEGNVVDAEEFDLFVDDPPTDYRKINSPGNLLPAGWHDSSSSDWEHVLKEEIWGQN